MQTTDFLARRGLPYRCCDFASVPKALAIKHSDVVLIVQTSKFL